MMLVQAILIAAATTTATTAATARNAAPAAAVPGPDRLLRCTIGRVTNMAAATPAEMGLEGNHPLVILQPDAAIEYAERPPRPNSAAALVRFHDPETVLKANRVGTVIDAWPKAIDLLTRLPDGSDSFVSIGSIALVDNTALVSAGIIEKDHETVRPTEFYQGNCTFEIAPGLAKTFETLAKAKK